MDIQALSAAIGIVRVAVATLRELAELLPDNQRKQEALSSLEQAQLELELAEAETAESLGYELCRNHWPPEVMLSPNDENWECPRCGNTRNASYVV
jgi:hypothetical protein